MRDVFRVMIAVAMIVGLASGTSVSAGKVTCPVCKKQFDEKKDTVRIPVNSSSVSLCSDDCVKSFSGEPEKYLDTTVVGKCPIMKGKTAKLDARNRFIVNNGLYYVCCGDCRKGFPKQPWKFVGQVLDPVLKKSFQPAANSPQSDKNGATYFFASDESKKKFDKEPDKYVIAFGGK